VAVAVARTSPRHWPVRPPLHQVGLLALSHCRAHICACCRVGCASTVTSLDQSDLTNPASSHSLTCIAGTWCINRLYFSFTDGSVINPPFLFSHTPHAMFNQWATVTHPNMGCPSVISKREITPEVICEFEYYAKVFFMNTKGGVKDN
jgi:hypothetical protein